jgi:hypothetical protein
MREVAVLGAHPSAAIEEEDDPLVVLGFVLAADQLALAARRLPVDLADRIAGAVLAQLVELEALAAKPLALDPDVAGARGLDQLVEARGRREIRIDADRPRRGSP